MKKLIGNELYNILHSNLKFVQMTPDQDEIIIRCPMCGDSEKSSFKGHLYIQNVFPYKYFCQRCYNFSGVVNKDFFNELEIEDLKALEFGYNNFEKAKSINYNKTKGKHKFGINKFKVPSFNIDRDYEKYEYIKTRLNIKNDYIFSRKNIIWNLNTFLKINKINSKVITTSEKLLETLNEFYVGFLSIDSSTIILRCISDNSHFSKKRYYNRRLIKDDYATQVKYVAYKNNTSCNLIKESYTLALCEGIFDALQIYDTFKDDGNLIVSAVNGKNYLNAILYFIKNGLFFFNEILIFSDQDVESFNYLNLKHHFPNIKIRLFYNELGKDFGVKKSEISYIEKQITHKY